MYTAIDYTSLLQHQSTDIIHIRRRFEFYSFITRITKAFKIISVIVEQTEKLVKTKTRLESQLLKSRGILTSLDKPWNSEDGIDLSNLLSDVADILRHYGELKQEFDTLYESSIMRRQPLVKSLIILVDELIDNFYNVQRKIKKLNVRVPLQETSDLAHQLSSLSTRTLERTVK